MLKLERILVATDLTPNCKVAYLHAAALAKAYDASVILMHVGELADVYAAMVDKQALANFRSGIEEACRRELEQHAALLGLPEGRVTIELSAGRPWRAILDQAGSLQADLIVLTKPRGLQPAVFGSTEKRVVRRAKVPVLLVDPVGQTLPALPAAVTYRRVIYPTDFSRCAEHGLPVAASLAARLEADLLVVHVLPTPVPHPVTGAAVLPKDLEQDFRRRAGDKLRVAAAPAEEIAPTEARVVDGMSIAGALADLSEDDDLLVIPSHGRGSVDAILLGSVAERLLRATTRPVLVLRRGYLKKLARSAELG